MNKLLLFVLMLLPMVASADVTGKCGANVYYSYNESTQKLTISGKGPMYDYDDMMDDYSYPWRGCSIKFLEIEDGVTSVGDFNFSNKGMISLSLPNSVTSIGQCAFYGCGSLNSIALPNSLTRIGNNAFTGCNNLTTIVSEIVNPYSIDNSVFSSVFSKAKLIVPKGTISKYKATDGWKSFANIVEATGNEEADITDNGIYYHLKSDGSLEVTGLASWTTVADIPSSIIVNGTKYRVTSIGAYAFKGRSDIMYLSIPYSIKSIGEYAFMDCGSNMTVNIADPESWCQMQLGNEHASPLSSAGKMLVHDIETTSFEVPSTVTSIGAFTFYQCSCLTSVNVPSTVTSIGSSAFEDCDYLTTLTLSKGLQSIGGSAFEGCKRLPLVTIPSSVKSIAINAFKNCSGLSSVISEIENPFIIDNSVFNGIPSNAQLIVPKGTMVAYQATEGWNRISSIVEFGDNGQVFEVDGIYYRILNIEGKNFVSVTIGNMEYSGDIVIPNQVTYNGTTYIVFCHDWGVFNSSSLTSISIGIADIGEYAFGGCSNLKTVIFTNAPRIGDDAFSGCNNLTSIIIPNGSFIRKRAFANCKGLTSLILGDNVGIETDAFGGCSNLKTIVSEIVDPLDIDNHVFDGIPSDAQLIVPQGTKTKYQAKSGWNKFTNIVESSGKCGEKVYYFYDGATQTLTISGEGEMWGWQLVEIDDRPWRSFYKNIRSIVINSGVTSIGNWAFTNFESLTSVTIPSSVATIYDCAFLGCSGLTSVTIPNGVIMIEDDDWGGAFGNCTGLTSIIIPNSVTSLCSLGGNTFRGCSNLTSIKVESGNQKYDSRDNCNAIIEKSSNTLISGCKNTIIPNSVTSIGYKAFRDCRGLTSITIPNSVTSIGGSAFYGCSGLTSVTIPNSVTSIGSSAFYGCSGLTSVTIPNSVTSIRGYTFYGCSGLTTITSEIENPFEIEESVFGGTSSNAKLIVPKGTKEKYQYTKGWNKFSNIVEVGGIGYVFEADGIYYMIGENNTVSVSHGNTKYFGDIVIPNQVKYSGTTYSVTRIEDHAFYECCDLTSIKIPNSVTRIGSAAFHGCNLTSVVIGKNVTGMGSEAFKNNSNLTSVVCNSNSVAIGSSFFEECYNLKYICVTSDEYPGSFLGTMKCQCIMPQSVFDGGVPEDITNYVTYSAAPKFITVKSTTATTATLELTPIDLTGGSTGGTPYEVTIFGLKPGSFVKGFWKDGSSDQGLASIPTVTTKNLVMNVQPAKPTSKIKARLLATVNELDDDTHFGFEWLRYDAPDNMTPNKVSAPLYDGQIVGTLNNLNPDVYYKYRPYYKSEDGSLFYDEWESFITGDADVFFEPETHTKDVVEVSSVSAELAGVWIEGTEDIDEKGFEYWAVPGGNTRAAGRDVKKVIVSGKKTSVVVEDLAVGTVYGYRSYMKTVSGITYGEEKTFMTINVGDVNGDGNVDFTDVNLVVSHIMGNTPIGFNMDAADVNNDGKVNAADIVLINGMIKK